MRQIDGLRNFTVNIKPIMTKIKNDERLTLEEAHQVLQFYLEVADYIWSKEVRNHD